MNFQTQYGGDIQGKKLKPLKNKRDLNGQGTALTKILDDKYYM